MAKLFVTLRLTGQVGNEAARDLLAQLSALTDACEAAGVDVKQSVDARLDPEPELVVHGVDLSSESDVTAVVASDVEPDPANEDPV